MRAVWFALWASLGRLFLENLEFCAGQTMPGVLTKWDDWSPCDATCGKGLRSRYRACYPIHGQCNGSLVEMEKCTMKSCPAKGTWSSWTRWSNCTKPCGIGTTSRTRTCLSAKAICAGGDRHVKICNPQQCTAAGGWSAWNEWSSCSAKCGLGVKYQDRTCEDPPPSNGGTACRGAGTRISHCFRKPCADDVSYVAVFGGQSYLLYEKTLIQKRLLTLYIKFLPEEQDGLLIYRHHGNETSRNHNDTIMVRLEDAHLEVYVQLGGISDWIRTEERLELDKWHDVFVAVGGSRISTRIDNGLPIERKYSNIDMSAIDLDQHMFVGGLSPAFMAKTSIGHAGFIGHVSTVRVNYESYFLEEHADMSTNEETNHPLISEYVVSSDMDSNELYPTFGGDDYATFVCSNCSGKPHYQVQLLLKPSKTDGGLIWVNYGGEPGSAVMVYFKKGTIVMCVNLGKKNRCTSTEFIPVNEWLALDVVMAGTLAKLRLNHEKAYILASGGTPYRAGASLHFAGGEQELWTAIYMTTRLTHGMYGILYSLAVNKVPFNVRKEVAVRETGRLISSIAASVAAKYDEYHEPPVSDLDLICDLTVYDDKLDVEDGLVYWIKEGEIVNNFSGIVIEKVAGMKHGTRMSIRSTEVAEKDGFYGCLLRTPHREFLVHVFGVTFDDANEIDIMEVAESSVLAIVLVVCAGVLIALGVLLKSGFLKRFPTYNAIIERLPSWFSDGHRKDFLRRHTASLQRSGILEPDDIHRIMSMQEKAIQAPSTSDLHQLYGGDLISMNNTKKSVVQWAPEAGNNTNLITYDTDSDYDAPVERKQSEGIVFPPPITEPFRRSARISMRVPEHIRKNPDAFLPDSDVVKKPSGQTGAWRNSRRPEFVAGHDPPESAENQSTDETGSFDPENTGKSGDATSVETTEDTSLQTKDNDDARTRQSGARKGSQLKNSASNGIPQAGPYGSFVQQNVPPGGVGYGMPVGPYGPPPQTSFAYPPQVPMQPQSAPYGYPSPAGYGLFYPPPQQFPPAGTAYPPNFPR